MTENTDISDSLLELKGREPFGVGGRRMCFVHPVEPSKCVKVLRHDRSMTHRSKRSRSMIPAAWRRAYDNNSHEWSELSKLGKRIGNANMGKHIPRCYGMTATDMGPGLVLDLIRDDDGKISRTIRELITEGMALDGIRAAFDEFCAHLSEHRILTRNLLDHNLVVMMEDNRPKRVVMIDGFGDPAWIPFASWFSGVGRAKVARRKAEAWRRFERLAANGGVSDEQRRSSTWDQGILRHRG